MATYRDEPRASLAFDDSYGGHHYPTPQDTSEGFQGYGTDGGQYRDVMAQSHTDLVDDAYRPPTWDGSKYGQNTYLDQRLQQTKRSKTVIIGSIIALVIIIAIAVTVGVVVGQKKDNNQNLSVNKGNNTGNTDNNNNNNTGNPDNNTAVGDPSVFDKDPNLRLSFYGLAYTPEGSQLPECGNSLENVIKDVQLMSQLTTRIRLYGADCNQSALVLEAINRTKVNMTVFLGNYALATDNGTAYTRQRDVLKQTLQTYGANHTAGLTVGNEVMLNYVTQQGLTDPNSPQANVGAQIIINDIDDTKSMLKDMNLDSTILVGNSDAGSFFNKEVLSDVQYGMSNVHPWFANVSADQGANWTMTFFEQQNQALADSLSNHPQMYIAETGWPTESSDAGNANNGASDASIASLQTFLDTFVCQANTAGIKYFFFEFKDEPWKDAQFGGVEGWWGLFYSNGTMKSLTMPNCPSP